MISWKPFVVLAASSILGACASVPDVTVNYWLPKAETKVTVTQTVACDATDEHVFAVNTATPTTTYVADRTGAPTTFRIKDIDSSLGDTSLTVGLTDDGRLKTVNAVSTGQGQAIVTAAITVVKAVGLAAVSSECATIKSWGGGKPVTLTYSAKPDPAVEGPTSLEVEPGLRELHSQLKRSLPALKVVVGHATEVKTGVSHVATSDTVDLTLRRTAIVPLEVFADHDSVWKGEIIIPKGENYTLPIPKSALFGQQTFGLTLTDAGAVSSVTYAKVNGMAGALTAASSAVTATQPATDASQAAEVKAQADLIAQQQRLARCQATPADCT